MHVKYIHHTTLIEQKDKIGKCCFLLMVECQITMVESELQLSLGSLHFSSNLSTQPIQPSNWENTKIYTRGARMSFPCKLTNGVKITIPRLIERPNYNDGNLPKSDVNPICRQPINGDLISCLCEGMIMLS
jgi:hypothetical protein